MDGVEKIIAAFRNIHPDVVKACEGRCYAFALFLRSIWPHAKLLYDGNHVYTEINGKLYDVHGKHLKIDNLDPLDRVEWEKAHRWKITL